MNFSAMRRMSTRQSHRRGRNAGRPCRSCCHPQADI